MSETHASRRTASRVTATAGAAHRRWRLAVTSSIALAAANARYWTSVFPLVGAELSRWQVAAEAISDRAVRAVAVGKLQAERFNVELAATFATLAPRAQRKTAVKAHVALQVLYDYVDALEERLPPSPAHERALADAVAIGHRQKTPDASPQEIPEAFPQETSDAYPQGTSDAYQEALCEIVKAALAGMPAAAQVAEAAEGAAERCARAQALHHCSAPGAEEELRRWAQEQASATGLQWHEWLAGAQASVLCLHALIAAACDSRTVSDQAWRLDSLYLSIGALTALDNLVDLGEDSAAGQRIALCSREDPERLPDGLAQAARDALAQASTLAHASHHAMTLTGVVAYYASAPAGREATVQAAIERVSAELGPALGPALALMRTWRMAKRRGGRAQTPSRAQARSAS